MSTINFTKVNGIPTVQQPSGDVSFTGNVSVSSDPSLNQIIISENGKQKLWINTTNTLQVDGVTKTGTLSQLVGFIGPVFTATVSAASVAVTATRVFKNPYANSGNLGALKAELDAGENASIVLLGDSTGAGDTKWFYQFIQLLMTQYPNHIVKYHDWNVTSQKYDNARWLRGVQSDRYTTLSTHGYYLPHADIQSITGDIDLRAFVRCNSYTGTNQALVGKFNSAPNISFRWIFTGGNLFFQWSEDGTATKTATSTANISTVVANGADIWVRVTMDVDNGASGNTVTFYWSNDGIAWTQLGSPVVTAGITSLFAAPNAYWTVGAVTNAASGSPIIGRLYHASIRNGIDGQIVTPSFINQWTKAYYPNTPDTGSPIISVYNGSHSGANVSYLSDTTRMKTMVPPEMMATVIFSCQHNDSDPYLYSLGYHQSVWDAYYAAVKAKIKLSSFVINTQNAQSSPQVASDIASHYRRRAFLLYWAKKNNITSIDIYQAFVDNGLTTADGIHPTAAGYVLWAATYLAALNDQV